MTAIKICGLTRPCDIESVNRSKPEYIGFILNVPASRRNISFDDAARLRALLAPGIAAVGVFVDEPLGEVVRAAGLIGLDVIQLHGAEDEAYIKKARALTRRIVWKAFRMTDAFDPAAAEASPADEILLDSGRGSGETFDWPLADRVSRPFVLAGGLTPENIPDAVRRLRPKILDLSSGVETDGVKDSDKILAAIGAVRRADENLKR